MQLNRILSAVICLQLLQPCAVLVSQDLPTEEVPEFDTGAANQHFAQGQNAGFGFRPLEFTPEEADIFRKSYAAASGQAAGGILKAEWLIKLEKRLKSDKPGFLALLKTSMKESMIKSAAQLPIAALIVGIEQGKKLYHRITETADEKQQRKIARLAKLRAAFLQERIELLKQQGAYDALRKSGAISPKFYKEMSQHIVEYGKQLEQIALGKTVPQLSTLPLSNGTEPSKKQQRAVIAASKTDLNNGAKLIGGSTKSSDVAKDIAAHPGKLAVVAAATQGAQPSKATQSGLGWFGRPS